VVHISETTERIFIKILIGNVALDRDKVFIKFLEFIRNRSEPLLGLCPLSARVTIIVSKHLRIFFSKLRFPISKLEISMLYTYVHDKVVFWFDARDSWIQSVEEFVWCQNSWFVVQYQWNPFLLIDGCVAGFHSRHHHRVILFAVNSLTIDISCVTTDAASFSGTSLSHYVVCALFRQIICSRKSRRHGRRPGLRQDRSNGSWAYTNNNRNSSAHFPFVCPTNFPHSYPLQLPNFGSTFRLR